MTTGDTFSHIPRIGKGKPGFTYTRNNRIVKQLVLYLLGVLMLTFSVITFNRTKIWKDDLIMWNDAIEKYPVGERPYVNRGVAFLPFGNGTMQLWISPK